MRCHLSRGLVAAERVANAGHLRSLATFALADLSSLLGSTEETLILENPTLHCLYCHVPCTQLADMP